MQHHGFLAVTADSGWLKVFPTQLACYLCIGRVSHCSHVHRGNFGYPLLVYFVNFFELLFFVFKYLLVSLELATVCNKQKCLPVKVPY